MRVWSTFSASAPKLVQVAVNRLSPISWPDATSHSTHASATLLALGGEALLNGSANRATDPAIRSRVADLALYYPADRYELVELVPTEVKVRGYGDITLPSPMSWKLIADERTL